MSKSPNKVPEVCVVLLIVIAWHRVNESTPKTYFFIQPEGKRPKKKKKNEEANCQLEKSGEEE